ncbi:MAG: hypothetical protein QNL87_01480, partial [Gammaproteobacteria bacterium]|nr:hypothetical protein [Gammaproteobacteria bacterium]
EMQFLQYQYAVLKEQHADVVSALKLELEDMEEQLNESRSQADAVREGRSVLEQTAQQEI